MRKIFSVLIFLCFCTTSFASTNFKACRCHIADIVSPLLPTVVSIHTIKNSMKSSFQERTFDNIPPGLFPFQMFREFKHFKNFDEDFYHDKQLALGSGVLIDSNGYIVTNYHVVKDQEEIKVKLDHDKEFIAKIVGYDDKTDIALIKIDATKLPFSEFGDSDLLRVGDSVIAIGNPFGLGGTVTSGIVSSKSRDIGNTENILNDYIQTDTAINKGNSGGPLFDFNGKIIGINTAIYSSSGMNSGVGFAIPSSTVKIIVDQLKVYGKVKRGVLGVVLQNLTPEIAEGLDINIKKGVLVTHVAPDGAAKKVGLQEKDIIISYNDQKDLDARKLKILVSNTKVNSVIDLRILRSGKEISLYPTLVESQQSSMSRKSITFSGVEFSDLNDDLKNKYQINITKGVIVTKVEYNSPWIGLLKEGDYIEEINGNHLQNLDDMSKNYNLAKSASKTHITFLMKRANMTMFIALPIS